MKKTNKIDKMFGAFWIALAVSAVTGVLFMIQAVDLAGALKTAGAIASATGREGFDWAIGPVMTVVPAALAAVVSSAVMIVLGQKIEFRDDNIIEAQVIS